LHPGLAQRDPGQRRLRRLSGRRNARRPRPPGQRQAPVKSLFVHLRLHFQLLLAPVFLWGWLVAGGGLSWSVAIAFVALHVFLYAGATAFNSYYDRDEGPVGGLERPPPVLPALLPVALGMKAIGAVLAALVNLPFLVM